MFFSGAVTSSPIKRRLRKSEGCHSLDVSLLSPDSSYICYSSVDGSQPSSCRRSARLLTNGYYSVTEDSFSWDQEGHVSLTPCRTSVSYKEKLVRVFRRRRRPPAALTRLLSGVTERCQSWLDQKLFRGVFRAEEAQKQNQSWDWTSPDSAQLNDPSWSDLDGAELLKGHGFTYDQTEAPPPPGKTAPPPPDNMAPPPKILIQEQICSEAGLVEVPPPSHLYAGGSCPRLSPEHTGELPRPVGWTPAVTMATFLLLIFLTVILAALNSGCFLRSAAAASAACGTMATFMCLTKSGPLGRWRRAKTEDISCRNE